MQADPATAALLALALAAPIGCLSSGGHPIPDSESRYDALPPESMRRFAAARKEQDAGRVAEAIPELEALAREHPDNVPVGIWLQEAEIALAGGDAGEARRRAREKADARPTAANLVLAARLEPDAVEAGKLLLAAGKRDEACAWAPYARAFLAARAGDWNEVRSRLEDALAADPGNLSVRWLEAWMLARGGGLDEAIPALEIWIDRARGDPRVDPRLVREAEIDRALLAVLDGDVREARALLAGLEDPTLDPGRRRMIAAAAEQQASEPRAALAAAVDAESIRPGEILPVVQEALLHEFWLGDPAAAEAAWARVLALSRSSPELGALLERLRARVRLERLATAREKAAAERATSSPAPAPPPPR